MRGGVSQRVDLLGDFARVIPFGVAGDETVAGVQPMAYGSQIAAHPVGRRDVVLGGDGRTGQIRRFVIRVISLGDAVAAGVFDDDRGRQVQQVGREISAVDLPLVRGVRLAQQRSRSALTPVVFLLRFRIAGNRSPRSRSWSILLGDQTHPAAGKDGGLDTNGHHTPQATVLRFNGVHGAGICGVGLMQQLPRAAGALVGLRLGLKEATACTAAGAVERGEGMDRIIAHRVRHRVADQVVVDDCAPGVIPG